MYQEEGTIFLKAFVFPKDRIVAAKANGSVETAEKGLERWFSN